MINLIYCKGILERDFGFQMDNSRKPRFLKPVLDLSIDFLKYGFKGN